MRIPADGREFVTWPIDASHDDIALEVEFDHDGQWYQMERQPGEANVLIAGPDVANNPAEAVVLPLGTHTARIRTIDSPEIVYLDAFAVTIFDPVAPWTSATACWPVDVGCCGWTERSPDEEMKQRAVDLAGQSLRMLTGYRVGGCPVTVQPCVKVFDDHRDHFFGGMAHIAFANSNVSCDCMGEVCGVCNSAHILIMPGIVGRVDEVMVAGAVLDPSSYHVENYSRLVRTDGQVWPNTTNPDQFTVTYLPSHPVDAMGEYAAGLLACEYAKACVGDRQCRLPKSVVSIVRAGVSMELSQDAFPNGRTGIAPVDAYIRRWNPHNLHRPPRVFSPDFNDFTRVTS